MSMTDTHRTTTELRLDTETIEVIAAIEASVVEASVVEASVVEGSVVGADVAEAPVRARILWTRPDTGLWAANYGGYYGGTVDKQGTHYFVSDTFGQYVGDFRSLEEAQSKLAERLHAVLPDVTRHD